MSLKRDETKTWADARMIWFDGEEYVVAPLTLRQSIALSEVSKKLFAKRETGLVKIGDDKAFFSSDMIDDYLEVILIGLRRAYPDATKDDVLDLTGNVNDLVEAATTVMEQAGGKKETTPGESSAASGSTSLTG